MKNILIFLFAIIQLVISALNAQTFISATNYPFSTSTGDLYISPKLNTIINIKSDDFASQVNDIGFTFWFAGQPYTKFSVNENGLMTLGTTQILGSDFINSMESVVTSPKIAPYWDDLSTGTDGFVCYVVDGYTGVRTLTVTWDVTIPKNLNSPINAKFQVQLSESNGLIRFRYGTSPVPTNNNNYTIGIGKTINDFASITTKQTSTSSTCTYGVTNNSNTLAIQGKTIFTFTPDKNPPSIVITNLIPNTFGTENRTLLCTISDTNTFIPIIGNFVPRIYYKRGSEVTYVSTPGILQAGNGSSGSWLFTIDHSLLPGGAVKEGDQIDYFVVAQDQSNTFGVPNIKSSPSGVKATDVNTITILPYSPNKYNILSSIFGTKTIGIGCNYSSLTNEGGLFEKINLGKVIGNIKVIVKSDLTESGLNPLSAWKEGAEGPYKLEIVPDGKRIINLNGSLGLKLIGAKGVKIDGINDDQNSLSLIRSTGGGSSAVLELSNGASNDTITRTSISGYNSYASTFVFSILNSTSVPNSNNTISYCTISSFNTSPDSIPTFRGILLTGTNSIATGTTIDHNTFKNFSNSAIHQENGTFTNTTISNNEIYNTIAVSSGNNYTGINLSNNLGTCYIFNNKIHDIKCSSGTTNSIGISAIYCMTSLNDVLNIYNNLIYLDVTETQTRLGINGIKLNNIGTVKLNYNTIGIGGTGVISNSSYCINNENSGVINETNNILYNVRSNITRPGAGKHYGIYNKGTVTSNNNDLFVNGNGGFIGYYFGDKLTLDSLRKATKQDANSINVDPQFTSLTNFVPLNSALNIGTPIPGITKDINDTLRDVTYPTLGAYELIRNKWKGTIDTDWGNPLNWTKNIVPAADTDFSFDDKTVHNCILDQNRSVSNVTISSGAQLIIPVEKLLQVKGKIINYAGPTGLVIQASPTGEVANGSLIFHNDPVQDAAVQATVEMYTKASRVGSYRWQFFGIPVKSVPANPTFAGSYVREMHENVTGTTGHWVQLQNDSVLKSFTGYEITQESGKIIHFEGALENRNYFSGELSSTPEATYKGEHLIANPYTAAIVIKNPTTPANSLTFGEGMVKTVYLYNTGSLADWSTNNLNGGGNHDAPGQYLAVPQENAGSDSLPATIPSMQAFLVMVKTPGTSATVSIPYSSTGTIVKNTTIQRAPAVEKVYTRIDVTGSNSGDRMWIFTEPGCTRGFDNGWDGYKLMGSVLMPQIYALEPDANYQVNSTNDINDTYLGFVAGIDTTYTLEFTHHNITARYQEIYLLDLIENKALNITANKSQYIFQAKSDSPVEKRFKIIATPAEPVISTDKHPMGKPNSLVVLNTKNTIIVNNQSELNGNLYVYNVRGQQVGKMQFAANVISTFSVSLPTGLYLAKTVTSNNENTKILLFTE